MSTTQIRIHVGDSFCAVLVFFSFIDRVHPCSGLVTSSPNVRFKLVTKWVSAT
jgi:hypothetical protein